MRRLLASLGSVLLRRCGSPSAPAVPSKVDTPRELIAAVLPLVADSLKRRGMKLPADLGDLVAEVHAALPPEVRLVDAVENRPEFAGVVQCAALLLYRADRWCRASR